MAALVVAREHGEQRRVLARVVGVRRIRVHAVVRGEDEQVAVAQHPSQREPRRCSICFSASGTPRRRAGGRRPGRSPRGSRKRGPTRASRAARWWQRSPSRSWRRRVSHVHPDAREQVADLAHAVHGDAGGAELFEARAPGWVRGVVAPALAAAEVSPARPRTAARSRALPGARRSPRAPPRTPRTGRARRAPRRARRSGAPSRRRCGEDELLRGEVLCTKVLQDFGPAVGPVADEVLPGRGLERGQDLQESPGVGGAGAGAPHPSAPSAWWSTPCPARAGAGGRARQDRSRVALRRSG